MNIKKYINKKRYCKLIILLVLIIMIYISYLLINSPKMQIIKYIHNFNNINILNTSDYSTLFNNSKIGFNLDNQININSVGKNSTNLSFNLAYYEDINKNTNYIDLKSYYNYRSLISLIASNKNNKFYYTLNNIYNNYYYIDSNFVSLFKNKIDSTIKKAFIKSLSMTLDNNKFYKSNARDILNNNDLTLNKISVRINNNDIKLILSNFKIYLSKENANNKYDYILNNIDNLIESISTSNTLYIYSMYESNNNLVKQDIQIIDNDNKLNTIITYYDYDNKTGLKVTSNDSEIIYILLTDVNDSSQITGNIASYNVSGKISNNNINIDLNDNKSNSIIKIDGDISLEEVKENLEYEKNYNIIVKFLNNNNLSQKINVISKFKLFAGKDVVDLNITNALDSSKITTNDKSNLKNFILNNDIFSKLNMSNKYTNQ